MELVRPTRSIQLDLHSTDLTCSFSPNRKRAVTGVVGNTVRLWDLETGQCIRQLEGHAKRVWGLAWAKDPRFVLSGSWDTSIRSWNVETGRCLSVLEGHPHFVRGLAFSHDPRLIISTGGDKSDKSVRIWDLEKEECLFVLHGHTDGVYCALLTDDSARAVSGSRDGTIRVWDVFDQQCQMVIPAHRTHVQHLAWFREQAQLFSCSIHLRLWDLRTGECLQNFEGHTDTVRTVEPSPDGKLLVSASHDFTVRIWEISTGRCLQILTGHPGMVVNAAWTPDGRNIVSCDEQATVCTFPVL